MIQKKQCLANQNTFFEARKESKLNNEVYKEVYGHILNDSQRIRKEIMNEWGDTLMFGGAMPQEAIDELSTAARITGLSFDALAKHGVKISQVNGKPDLFSLTVRDESYVCHKSAIPSMVGFLDEVNIPGVSVEKPVEKIEKPKSEPKEIVKEPVKETVTETVVNHEDETKATKASEDDYLSFSEEKETEETDADEAEEQSTPEPVESESIPETASSVQDSEEEETEQDDDPEVKPLGAEIIGGTPNIGMLSRADIFIEEKKKKYSEFVYEMFSIAMTHSGMAGGGRPTEMQVMIAPLKIQKFACPSVPILVSVYCDGKIYHSSSYEQKEDGKNLVQMGINEFYLLFRGSFDANGKFHSYITTSGISANQGDIMNVTSNERFGDEAVRGVNNGHIKFRSMIFGDPGTIEVLPFGKIEDNEFVVMTKTDEFVDYIYISDTQGGMKKATVYTEEGKKNQILCTWDEDDCLNVELKEV